MHNICIHFLCHYYNWCSFSWCQLKHKLTRTGSCASSCLLLYVLVLVFSSCSLCNRKIKYLVQFNHLDRVLALYPSFIFHNKFCQNPLHRQDTQRALQEVLLSRPCAKVKWSLLESNWNLMFSKFSPDSSHQSFNLWCGAVRVASYSTLHSLSVTNEDRRLQQEHVEWCPQLSSC